MLTVCRGSRPESSYDAIEEQARNELGMIKRDEVFFQMLDHPTQRSSLAVAAQAQATAAKTDSATRRQFPPRYACRSLEANQSGRCKRPSHIQFSMD